MKLKVRLVFIFITSLVILLILTDQVFAQSTPQKDTTVVAVNELTDLEGNEWAFMAVQELVEKYDVLEGYPDSTFQGKKNATRFELAAAIYDIATYFSDQIALDRGDLAKLAKLMDEFSNELKIVQGRVDALETKVSDIDTRTKSLEGQIVEHKARLDEHEKRLAYSERRKGFLLERLAKGLVVDARDVSRGFFAAVLAPFNKDIRNAISK